MKILQTMPCRVKSYQSTLEGFNITDTYLISFNDICVGGRNILVPAGYADDVGSFLYIPFLSNLFDQTIENTTIYFFSFYGIICIFLSLVGLYKFYNSKLAKIHGTLAITIVGTLCIFISDTYCFYGLTSLALITWWSKISIFSKANYKKFFVFFIFTGILIAFSNTVRQNSGNDILLSIIFLIILGSVKSKNFTKLYIILLILTPILLINHQIDYLKNKSRNYLINNTNVQKTHDLNFVRPNWHNAYYSLGYLSIDGKDVPELSDSFSVKKAQEIKPDVIPTSKEYEKILMNEYFKFVKKHPFLYIQIEISKAGVILFYIILFFNIGIYYLYKNKFSLETMIFFIPGIIFNSLFGLATEPSYTYLLGLFAYSSLFTTKLIEDDFTKSS